MRLGAPIEQSWGDDAQAWVAAVQAKGYRAAYAPIDEQSSSAVRTAFRNAAQAHDIVIAEVGAWSNPMAVDAAERARAIRFCQERLALADELAAQCCVNIAGSRGAEWDGPDAANYHADTFALIVDTVREIIDAVQPRHTMYTLETMPWMWPDSPESYRKLLEAIDRPQMGVHLDPINMINSVDRFYGHRAFVAQCIDELGPYIRSCHIKDMVIERPFVVALRECAPGLGMLDYAAILRELQRLPADTPILLEHLQHAEQYDAAAAFVRQTAQTIGVAV